MFSNYPFFHFLKKRVWTYKVFTSVVTKYRCKQCLSRDKSETRRNVNAGHVTMTIIKCIMQYG